MVFFNYSTMQMAAKVVYYGPGLCGKTTNLQWIFDHTSNDSRGEMVSLATETDRTLFFDLLPIDVGTIAGFNTRIQLYTVPGQVFYNTTRKLVLKGVDGVVFVADSQRPMLQANIDSLDNLEENLNEMGLTLAEIPVVLQFNKRDLPNVMSPEELNEALNRHEWGWANASAIAGEGVFETLKMISKATLLALKRRLTKGRSEGSGPGRGPAAPGGRPLPKAPVKPPLPPRPSPKPVPPPGGRPPLPRPAPPRPTPPPVKPPPMAAAPPSTAAPAALENAATEESTASAALAAPEIAPAMSSAVEDPAAQELEPATNMDLPVLEPLEEFEPVEADAQPVEVDMEPPEIEVDAQPAEEVSRHEAPTLEPEPEDVSLELEESATTEQPTILEPTAAGESIEPEPTAVDESPTEEPPTANEPVVDQVTPVAADEPPPAIDPPTPAEESKVLAEGPSLPMEEPSVPTLTLPEPEPRPQEPPRTPVPAQPPSPVQPVALGAHPVPTPAAPSRPPARRRRSRLGGIDALAELEKLRRQALRPRATQKPVKAARTEVRRQLEMALNATELSRGRRLRLTLQLADESGQVVGGPRDFEVDLESEAAPSEVHLRLEVDLRRQEG